MEVVGVVVTAVVCLLRFRLGGFGVVAVAAVVRQVGLGGGIIVAVMMRVFFGMITWIHAKLIWGSR